MLIHLVITDFAIIYMSVEDMRQCCSLYTRPTNGKIQPTLCQLFGLFIISFSCYHYKTYLGKLEAILEKCIR